MVREAPVRDMYAQAVACFSGHAGEGETSMMLHVDPSLVDLTRAKGVVPDLPSHVEIKWTFDELTPYGATGDPSKATPEKGKLMAEALVNLLVEFIKKMDDRDWEFNFAIN